MHPKTAGYKGVPALGYVKFERDFVNLVLESEYRRKDACRSRLSVHQKPVATMDDLIMMLHSQYQAHDQRARLASDIVSKFDNNTTQCVIHCCFSLGRLFLPT